MVYNKSIDRALNLIREDIHDEIETTTCTGLKVKPQLHS